MWPNPQETADLVTFVEEILNGKLHFCAVLDVGKSSQSALHLMVYTKLTFWNWTVLHLLSNKVKVSKIFFLRHTQKAFSCIGYNYCVHVAIFFQVLLFFHMKPFSSNMTYLKHTLRYKNK